MLNSLKPPLKVRNLLWDLDQAQVNVKRDKKLIISAVMNQGDLSEIRWLLKQYPKKDLRECVRNPRQGFWNRLSLCFWSKLLNITPSKTNRKNALKNIS